MLPTGQEEGDEAGLLGHVELEAGAAEDVLHHGLRAARPLQEGEELFGLLRLLWGGGDRDGETERDKVNTLGVFSIESDETNQMD